MIPTPYLNIQQILSISLDVKEANAGTDAQLNAESNEDRKLDGEGDGEFSDNADASLEEEGEVDADRGEELNHKCKLGLDGEANGDLDASDNRLGGKKN